jgi:hypothetical protein
VKGQFVCRWAARNGFTSVWFISPDSDLLSYLPQCVMSDLQCKGLRIVQLLAAVKVAADGSRKRRILDYHTLTGIASAQYGLGLNDLVIMFLAVGSDYVPHTIRLGGRV